MPHKLLQINNTDGFTEEIVIDDTTKLFTDTDIGNITGMQQGDFAVINSVDLYVYHNSAWVKLPNGAVTSVNGKTGVITLKTDDIAEGTTNLYFTNDRAINAVNNQNINITGTAENANKLDNKTPDEYLFGQATDLGTVTSGAATLDLSLNNYFVMTVGADTTITITNPPASGNVAFFILELINGGNYALTFTGIKWQDKLVPIFTTNGTDLLGFITRDGGASYAGFVISYNIG